MQQGPKARGLELATLLFVMALGGPQHPLKRTGKSPKPVQDARDEVSDKWAEELTLLSHFNPLAGWRALSGCLCYFAATATFFVLDFSLHQTFIQCSISTAQTTLWPVLPSSLTLPPYETGDAGLSWASPSPGSSACAQEPSPLSEASKSCQFMGG